MLSYLIFCNFIIVCFALPDSIQKTIAGHELHNVVAINIDLRVRAIPQIIADGDESMVYFGKNTINILHNIEPNLILNK